MKALLLVDLQNDFPPGDVEQALTAMHNAGITLVWHRCRRSSSSSA